MAMIQMWPVPMNGMVDASVVVPDVPFRRLLRGHNRV
jgi:hypothetical protein